MRWNGAATVITRCGFWPTKKRAKPGHEATYWPPVAGQCGVSWRSGRLHIGARDFSAVLPEIDDGHPGNVRRRDASRHRAVESIAMAERGASRHGSGQGTSGPTSGIRADQYRSGDH